MCRLDSEGMVKISDFGLSEDIYTSGYFRQTIKDGARLPFKWMPPESLKDAVFTFQSDVVSRFFNFDILKQLLKVLKCK